MSREILFKAKQANNGEWVEGYYARYGFTGKEKHYIVPVYASDLYAFEVDKKTVCQYTGLTDKNGKKIWENDILRGHGNNTDLSKVVYGEFGMIENETLEVIDIVIGWHYEPIPTDALSKCEPFCLPMPLTDEYINRCEFEVIGNIFDNPELLTTNKGA